MKPNKATIELIRRFEGCRLEAYLCPAGVWTIGWGHAATSGIAPIPKKGMVITQEQADQIHEDDLAIFARQITSLFKTKVSPNVFGACLSLAFNIGVGAFRKSTCLRRLNAGDVNGAAEALQWFNKANGKTMRGLVRRRKAEAELMLAGVPNSQPPMVASKERSSPAKSRTVQASVVAAGSAAGSAVTALSALDSTAQYIVLGFAGLGVLMAIWIMKERLRKWAEGDR